MKVLDLSGRVLRTIPTTGTTGPVTSIHLGPASGLPTRARPRS